jgi:hypothetical protein
MRLPFMNGIAEIDVDENDVLPCARENMRVGTRIAVLGGIAPIGTLASVIEIANVGDSRKSWAVADFAIPHGTTLNNRISERRGFSFMEDEAIVISN